MKPISKRRETYLKIEPFFVTGAISAGVIQWLK